jgi:hypothetical protein
MVVASRPSVVGLINSLLTGTTKRTIGGMVGH